MRDILLTGGIGDVIALDAHWTLAEKASVQQLHLATRQGRLLAPLFLGNPAYPNLVGVTDWWDYDRNDFFCYLAKDHAVQWGCPIPDHVEDRSIWKEFIRITRNKVPVAGSSFLKHKVADRSPGLPDRYAVVVGYTPNNTERHQRVRNYRPQDWRDTLAWLRRRNLKGVVLNSSCPLPVPGDPDLIDLTGKTTLAEAMEVAKAASAFCGIDSWASILCGLHLPAERMAVLSRNEHLYRNRTIYYPAHEDHGFIRGWILP